MFQLEGGLWWSKVRERERERDIKLFVGVLLMNNVSILVLRYCS